MVEKRLGNTAGSTASASYTLGEDCGSATLSMSSTVSWMSATASNGTISITATEGNTGGERNGYIIPIVNGEECSNNKIKVTQEAGEEPPGPGCTCSITPKGLKATDTGEVTIATWSSSNCEGTATVELVDGGGFLTDPTISGSNIKGTVTPNTDAGSRTAKIKLKIGDSECSKEANITQAGTNTCYYTLDNTFSITCDTSTNKQMLSYSVTNENECSNPSSDQDFTIKLGNGNTYTVSGKPNDNKKQEVEISDSTTTVEWHNVGDESVSGKSSSFNVEQCQSKTIISFKLRVQMREELDPDLYFNSIQADFKLQGKAGTADAGKTVTIFSSDWINQPCPGEWFKDTNELCDIDGGSYCDDKKRWRISSPYTSQDLAEQGVTEENISNFKFVADMATHGAIKRAAGYDKDHNPTGCAPQNPTLHSNECYMTGFGQPIYGTGSGMPRFETDLTSLNNFPSEIIIRLH